MAKENNHPMGENSPNLVTLLLSGNLKPWELLKRKLADVITTQARFYKQT
jgi:hypothetical protein